MGFRATRPESKISILDPLTNHARQSLRQLAATIGALGDRVDASFGSAVHVLAGVEGHVVVLGVGKSGLIGRKLAATFASTGTPSFFVHAGEAAHGDLGMITDRDAVLLISYSGETREVIDLLPHLRTRTIPTVALVGRPTSTLAQAVDVAIDIGVEREICPHDLAPTSSTVATVAMGDALAVSLMRLRGFQQRDFARLHPGGSVGRRLARVWEAVDGKPIVCVSPTTTARECLLRLAGNAIHVAVVLEDGQFCGTVDHQALRAALDDADGLNVTMETIMDVDAATIAADAHVADAEREMSDKSVDSLVVIADDGGVVGLFFSS